MDKQVLRKQILDKRLARTGDELTGKSRFIHNQVRSLSTWQEAQTIAFYIPVKKEVDTWPLIDDALNDDKNVLAPIIEPPSPLMRFAGFYLENELLPGPFGLKQPILGRQFNPHEIDLVIVPGVAFTKNRFRLGFGKGYYDRYLQNFQGTTVALAFDFQIVDDLPLEVHDQAVDMLVTNDAVYSSPSFI